MSMTSRILAGAAAAATALAMAGCTSGMANQSESDPVESDPSPASSYQVSTDTIREIFVSSDFVPDAFSSPEEMVESIYPDVSVSPDCFAVLGVGAIDPEANVVFGPSIDRSLTVQISSFTAPAVDYYATMSDHADACIADPQLVFAGNSVDATVEREDLYDDKSFVLTLTASISGSEVSVIARVEKLEENVVSVVGWDPYTNEANVPRATGMLIEKMSDARIERINAVK